jgi:hypothetical protein
MASTRRLAAILAADIVGYSRLMGLDEAGTARALREHRSAADPLIAEHGGRIVKTTGDGLLIEFASVVGAVECALALQHLAAERNAEVPGDRRLVRGQGRAEGTNGLSCLRSKIARAKPSFASSKRAPRIAHPALPAAAPQTRHANSPRTSSAGTTRPAARPAPGINWSHDWGARSHTYKPGQALRELARIGNRNKQNADSH